MTPAKSAPTATSVVVSATTTAPAAVARTGSFAGPNVTFGAPLLSIHPIDNKFPDLKKKAEDDDEAKVEEQQPPKEGK